tara:strand:- start:505 stop:993 length:489 start_codon:yes stop_codon:yes gene_type:complete
VITDATYEFSDSQALATPVDLASGTFGHASTNYVKAEPLNDSGGRTQFVHVQFTGTSALNQNVTVELRGYDTEPSSNAAAMNTDNYKTVASFVVLAADTAPNKDFYLPLASSGVDTLSTPPYKWWRVVYLIAENAAGGVKVSTSLTDAITNDPRIFSAKNST